MNADSCNKANGILVFEQVFGTMPLIGGVIKTWADNLESFLDAFYEKLSLFTLRLNNNTLINGAGILLFITKINVYIGHVQANILTRDYVKK